eukprot:CAMPEP_0197693816 /NCGR_PEP_ID=MMETSP1338-20131121/113020_1 /TAXON_ID=43686 ORGANISM="Pelagodinium beii, Strain RCC1491" /NCGR_SAMPLE_ID=MMETSP1338 /ASSEMBLY_ACC=CAM_ASM_000754 /LENGTH=608 /DNA_ID=CAMNT_0043276605 /DNA_START=97 /DNA_END=1923 /DNA_ORIENTATION=+
MALLLVTVLDPIKQATLEVLECTFVLLYSKCSCFSCCLRSPRKGYDDSPRVRTELVEPMKKILLFSSMVITICLAGRLFWLVGRIVWLSGEAVTQDFTYYQEGVQKRGKQVQMLLHRFHLENKAQLDMKHMSDMLLSFLRYAAEFLSQHVFYTVTQVSLTTIFVLFLLYSPVQRDFSPIMQGVFESMELYLKLKTFISITMGITNGVALSIIGLELPAAWGLLTFLANFIPNIGGPTISILPCLITLLDVRKSFFQVAAAFFAQFFLHFNIANFVEPVVFGSTEEIHSVVVLLGLSFFGYIWGFTGMFLSVPLLFAMHSWLDVIARTPGNQEAREDARFIMGVLEGRWLADSAEEGEDNSAGGGQTLLVGNMEAPEENLTEGFSATQQASGLGPGASQPKETEANPVVSTLKAWLAVRDPDTEEVVVCGLLLRWILMAGTYTVIFFGFAIFHFDLQAFIHASGGDNTLLESSLHTNKTAEVVVALTTSLAPEVAASTSAGSVAKAVAAAAAAFPFHPPPDPSNVEGKTSGERDNSSHDIEQSASQAFFGSRDTDAIESAEEGVESVVNHPGLEETGEPSSEEVRHSLRKVPEGSSSDASPHISVNSED